MRKSIFTGRKYILSSGREIDLSAEHINDRVIISAMFNFLDPVQEIGHCGLIRIENNQTIAFESLSSKKFKDESLREVLKPIEGLNGSDALLKIHEFNELVSVMQQFAQKIDKELAAKK
ncbi:MAG: hypothetical protein HYR97_05360 [Candidatus Melainabacteria bacterium]|nr:hypothetical protein [Candidatus Melainabacteria bacterium]